MGKTLFGRRIYRLGSVSSTQDAARELFEKGEGEGAIIVAEEQTLGRGRRGRSWDSQAGKGLWMSVLLCPADGDEMLTWIPLWAGVAVRRALCEILNDTDGFDGRCLRLKWPNDIMVHDRKLGGIIAENVQNGNGRQAVIVGIGLNLLHRKTDFPPHLRSLATSLHEEIGRAYSPDEILGRLIMDFEDLHSLLHPVDPTGIKGLWLSSAWGLESGLRIVSGDALYEGIFADLGPRGELGLRTPNNDLRFFSSVEGVQRLGIV